MLSKAKDFLRRQVRGAQRASQYPLLLPHHTLTETGIKTISGDNVPLSPTTRAILAQSDGRTRLADIAKKAKASKADVIKSVVSGKAAVDKIEFLPDTDVRVHGKTAFVAGKVDLTHPTSIVHMHVLHVWEKGPQGWQLVARQATKLAK